MVPLSVARKPGLGATRPGGTNDLLARAPRLREAGQRMVSALVKGLQTMAGPATTVEGVLAGLAMERTRDLVAAHRPHVASGTIKVKDLPLTLLATFDDTLVHGLVELFCGGNGVEAPPVAPRVVTSIDQQFALTALTLVASAIATDWAVDGFAGARAARLDGPLTVDVFGPSSADVAVMSITVGIFGLHGTMRLALPSAAVERFAPTATGEPIAEAAPDAVWASALHREISRAPVALAAYLDAKDIPLSALAGLKIGQILALPTDARSRATLISDGRVLYRGEVGQDDNHYSLRIDEVVSEPIDVARLAERRASYLDAFKA